MSGKVRADSRSVTRTTRVGARRRAQQRVVFATRGIPGQILGEHLGVSAARARHQKSDDDSGHLTEYCALIADPRVKDEDAGRMMAAALAAFEERALYAPTEILRARREELRSDVEHRLEAAQNRAMVINCPRRIEAYLAHAGALVELAVIEAMLGVEETTH